MLSYIFIKKRASIAYFFKKKEILKFIITGLSPAVISFALSIISLKLDGTAVFDEEITKTELVIYILVILTMANLIAQFVMWLKDAHVRDLRWENEAAKHAYNGLFEIQISKNTQLRGTYHNRLKRGQLDKTNVPYNIFDQIRKITWEFGSTVGKITGVDTKNLYAAFIYRYVYLDAVKQDKEWRWVTGRGATFKHSLDDFSEMLNSTFNHMSHNDINSLFYNDKKEAVKDQRYIYSSRDYEHNLQGSFLAAKVAFSGNDHVLCEGIVMINSYGKKFLDDSSHTEEELRMLLLDNIFPCYKRMLTSELAMLYFCHKDEKLLDEEKEDLGEE